MPWPCLPITGVLVLRPLDHAYNCWGVILYTWSPCNLLKCVLYCFCPRNFESSSSLTALPNLWAAIFCLLVAESHRVFEVILHTLNLIAIMWSLGPWSWFAIEHNSWWKWERTSAICWRARRGDGISTVWWALVVIHLRCNVWGIITFLPRSQEHVWKNHCIKVCTISLPTQTFTAFQCIPFTLSSSCKMRQVFPWHLQALYLT